MPTTPTMPTARRQDLDKACPSTRTSLLESKHNLAKYTRYLKKLLKGEVGYINRLRDFSANLSAKISSFENIVTSTLQAIQKLIFLSQTDTPEKFQNICQIATLQIYWCVIQNGYHLTAMLQLKINKFFRKNHFQICRKLGLPTNNQRLDHRTKFFYLVTA